MKVQFSPYSMTKKKRVNAVDHSPQQEGALVKLIDSENNWGVADLCPWPALGDPALKDEVRFKAALYQRALVLAHEDLTARQQGTSLLQDKWVANNILIANYHECDLSDPGYINQTLKIKGDREVQKLAGLLNGAPKEIQFRVDFNGVLDSQTYQLFLDALNDNVQIEYVEDPCLYESQRWIEWNKQIPLAKDFIEADDGYTFQIMKPARHALGPDPYFTITSSMDHPVGVAHALRYAQSHAQNKSGLLTLNLYEQTRFHSYFIYRGESEINFAPSATHDFGIGMTDALDALVWQDSV